MEGTGTAAQETTVPVTDASRGGSSRGRDEYREPREAVISDEYDEPRRGGSRDEYDVPRSSRGSYNDGRNTGVKNGGSKGKKNMSKKRKARKTRRIVSLQWKWSLLLCWQLFSGRC